MDIEATLVRPGMTLEMIVCPNVLVTDTVRRDDEVILIGYQLDDQDEVAEAGDGTPIMVRLASPQCVLYMVKEA